MWFTSIMMQWREPNFQKAKLFSFHCRLSLRVQLSPPPCCSYLRKKKELHPPSPNRSADRRLRTVVWRSIHAASLYWPPSAPCLEEAMHVCCFLPVVCMAARRTVAGPALNGGGGQPGTMLPLLLEEFVSGSPLSWLLARVALDGVCGCQAARLLASDRANLLLASSLQQLCALWSFTLITYSAPVPPLSP